MAPKQDSVAVVTGSNKGIGFEIVKQLASQGITTVLTARDEGRGLEAVQLLKDQNLEVLFHPLDVSDPSSVSKITAWLQEKFGTIDILVNNAGITSKSYADRLEGAKAVLETNYYGAKRMTEAILPILKPGGRIINISSRLGQFENNYSPLKNEWQKQKLSDEENLTEQVINSCLKEFIEAVQRGKLTDEGYPQSEPDYAMSKFAMNAYTRILSRELATGPSGHTISVNAVCPGYTKTDLTGGLGYHTVEQGADTAVWLATWEGENYPSGKFFAERNEIHF